MLASEFLPQNFWQVSGTYELSFCSKRNAVSVVLTMLGGGALKKLPDGKKNELCVLTGGGDTKLSDFP